MTRRQHFCCSHLLGLSLVASIFSADAAIDEHGHDAHTAPAHAEAAAKPAGAKPSATNHSAPHAPTTSPAQSKETVNHESATDGHGHASDQAAPSAPAHQDARAGSAAVASDAAHHAAPSAAHPSRAKSAHDSHAAETQHAAAHAEPTPGTAQVAGHAPPDSDARTAPAPTATAKTAHENGTTPAVTPAAASHSPAKSDVRVVIDVSGSMKQTDPSNLRVPALKLLAGLLPPDAQSGVWTFAEGVDVLLARTTANAKWKRAAEQAAARIHSRGLFTNIEAALTKVTQDWKTPDPSTRREVIFLTDGVVDIDKDPAMNAASQQRIIAQILPTLHQVGVRINTIALSNSADIELLRRIAITTDGWFEQADTAETLQRVFLHMFEKAAPRDTLPLKDNRFHVDSSVAEMTLVVFRNPESPEIEIIMPDGKKAQQPSAPPNYRWHHDVGYDMVTIEKPVAGDWVIKADTDPDNRVVVVSNLKLQTSELPNNVMAGEEFKLVTQLTAGSKPVDRKSFLNLVRFQVTETDESGHAAAVELHGPSDAGSYEAVLGENLQKGKYELRIAAESPTFQRERRQSLLIFDNPVEPKATLEEVNGARGYRIDIPIKPGLIDMQTAHLSAKLEDPDGKQHKLKIPPATDAGWQVQLTGLDHGRYRVSFQVKARTKNGQDVTFTPDSLVLDDERPKPEDHAKPTEPPPVATAAEPPAAAPEAAEPAPDWLVTLGIVGGINLLLAGAGTGGYLFWRKRRANADVVEDEL